MTSRDVQFNVLNGICDYIVFYDIKFKKHFTVHEITLNYINMYSLRVNVLFYDVEFTHLFFPVRHFVRFCFPDSRIVKTIQTGISEYSNL